MTSWPPQSGEETKLSTSAGLLRVGGIPGSGAWAYLARCLLTPRPECPSPWEGFSGRLLLVRRDNSDLEDIRDAAAALAPLFNAETLADAFFGEDPRTRLSSLELLRGGARLAMATPEALRRPAPDALSLSDMAVEFRNGIRLPRDQAVDRLLRAGYRRVDFVETPGEFAVRGAVLDFYGLEPVRAVRVLYDEDDVASLRAVDPVSQQTLDLLSSARAVCASEPETGEVLGRWFGEGWTWLVEEGAEVQVPERATMRRAGAASAGLPETGDFGVRPNGPYLGDAARAWEELRRFAGEGYRVALFSLNHGEDGRMQELLDAQFNGQPPCQFLVGPLRHGFHHPGHRLAALSVSEIFSRNYRPSLRWRRFTGATRGALRLRELRRGDYVVHQEYGLARFKGLEPVASPGHGTVDCLVLEFRGSDVLYLPMQEFGKVQRYSGSEGKRPRLSSLDTRRWEEVKRAVSEGVRELADALLKVQAERAARPGFAFPPEGPMERAFAAEFPYEETPDQSRAIADVLADMESPHPMDRVVVGDVGFGKTEVAMRAAFKCASAFKQTAVLAPTTILAEQHYRTFCARFADYPVRLGLLTRFQGKRDQAHVLKGMHEGTVDVVIGTARLLQKDIRFKDLGLVVIDEEHRFGVRDKERFKMLRRMVDCLALSATPIPRTLNQSFSGLRGISLIQSPPQGRQPIVTRVGPYDEGMVAAAVAEELGRGGQIYYVHNRVRTLEDCRRRLEKLIPQARLATIHGRMRGSDIEKTMWDFFNRKFDVLIASTIIESGLDIPSVNTLFVENAQDFGLAQLYQLRGRIGRERQRAVCYLFFPAGQEELSSLTEQARQRLEALREFTELGSGVKLAMRDLEIRGAGELLGPRQHGFLNAVGAEMYADMLNAELSRRQGRPEAPAQEQVQLDIQVKAYIPEDYLPGEMERLEYYKRILKADHDEAQRLRRELEDLCGPLPPPVSNLFRVLAIRAVARRAQVGGVTQRERTLEILFRADADIAPGLTQSWLKTYAGRLRFCRRNDRDGVSIDIEGEDPLSWLETFLSGVRS
ncbi:MAG TPA: transcription-repair coupling factor [Elusimicrobia bacterium]|nr:transcription-repair coupling factor [Elusimicrobiota bacterium]HBT60955.1 transcription-repair coupling factor [Elusimicrobiota bacterium]